MNLVMPELGLLFWMVVSFSLLLMILKKYAWKPILKSLADRENSIESALNSAELAKLEMRDMMANNENLLKEAIQQRERILAEANEIKETIVSQARNIANTEAEKIIESARIAIEQEKALAMVALKNSIASYSIEIAEKILRDQLSDPVRQKELINHYVENISIN